jgi:hypothetical protein
MAAGSLQMGKYSICVYFVNTCSRQRRLFCILEVSSMVNWLQYYYSPKYLMAFYKISVELQDDLIFARIPHCFQVQICIFICINPLPT